MTIQVTYTSRDIKNYIKDKKMTTTFGKVDNILSKIILFAMLSLLIVSILGMLIIAPDLLLDNKLAVAVLAVWGCITLLMLLPKHFFNVYWLSFKSQESSLRNQKYVIDEKGIFVSKSTSDTLRKWQEVRSVVEGKTCLIIILKTGMDIHIPWRCIENDNQLEAIKKIVEYQGIDYKVKKESIRIGNIIQSTIENIVQPSNEITVTTECAVIYHAEANEKELFSFHLKGILHRKDYLIWVVIGTYLAYHGILGAMMAPELGIKVGCLCIALVGFLFASFAFIPTVRTFIQIKKQAKSSLKITYNFLENQMNIKGANRTSKIQYSDIKKVSESRTYYTLKTSKKERHLIVKRAFPEDSKELELIKSFM